MKLNNGYLVSVGTLKLLKLLKACARLFTAAARAFSDFETNIINYSHFCCVCEDSAGLRTIPFQQCVLRSSEYPKFLPSKLGDIESSKIQRIKQRIEL